MGLGDDVVGKKWEEHFCVGQVSREEKEAGGQEAGAEGRMRAFQSAPFSPSHTSLDSGVEGVWVVQPDLGKR